MNELLTRYEANDQAAVVAMLDNPVIILGSDFREAARSPVELEELMSRGFGQWGQAKFTDLRDLRATAALGRPARVACRKRAIREYVRRIRAARAQP